MKKRIPILVAIAGMTLPAVADITVKVAPEAATGEYNIEYGYLKDMAGARPDDSKINRVTKTLTDGVFTLETLPEGPGQYVIPTAEREYLLLYTKPGDDLTVNIESVAPLAYNVTGSKLMEDISALDKNSSAFLNEYRRMLTAGEPNPLEVARLAESYDAVFADFLKANPDAEAVPYALLHLDGQDFMDSFNAMTPAAKESPLFPLLEPKLRQVERHLAAEQRKQQLESGTMTAPDFTYKDMEGKDVSLSDFRGKWVIIDFWGTWCPWCIKGFPELKEAYSLYKPELEIVGVACNDPYDDWVAGVHKYELPWVNLYNPDERGGQLLTDYGVEGFPTKVIVNPEGKIVNITSGHNPEFFDILKGFLGK